MEDFDTRFDRGYFGSIYRESVERARLREEAVRTKDDVAQSGSVLGRFEDIENAAISQVQREDKYGGLRAVPNTDYDPVVSMDFNSLYPRLIKANLIQDSDEDAVKYFTFHTI